MLQLFMDHLASNGTLAFMLTHTTLLSLFNTSGLVGNASACIIHASICVNDASICVNNDNVCVIINRIKV